MLGDIDRYDDIDRYVTDKMTPNERESFVKAVESDPSLRAQLHLVEDIKDGLMRRQEKVEQIQKWQQDSLVEKKRRTNIVRLSSISAAAAILIGAFISYPTSYWGLQDRSFETEMEASLRSSGDFHLISYWDAEDYDACLIAIQEEIDSYRNALEELDLEVIPLEEYEGKLDTYTMQIDNLRWANIQTLLRMKEYEGALIRVDEYLSSGGFRNKEALKLQKKLNRKLSR